MQSWIRRGVALAALCGAAWLDLAARGAPARASVWAHALQGEAVARTAGVAAVAMVGAAVLLALSPLGRARD